MRETLGTYAGRIAHERKTRMRFLGILIAVALVVAAGVSWQLHYTGVAAANETYCGIEEHQHIDECYETQLICGLEDGEFDPAVAAVHSHSDACYETILTCTLPEHVHTVECLVDPNTEESPENIAADDAEDPDESAVAPLAYTGNGSGKVVINLGNGNGVYNFADYTGSKAAGTLLRYTTDDLRAYAGDDGKLTVHLPAYENLGTGQSFTVVDAVDSNPAVTFSFSQTLAYQYRLIGWANIATGEYFDVSNGTTDAIINLDNENVFYADWVAASYDYGSSDDADLRTDTISTSGFVTMHMYDYNDLFNLYSETVAQTNTTSEAWTDSGTFYSTLLGKNGGTRLTNSFAFVNDGTTSSSQASTGGMLSWPNSKTAGNTWTGSGQPPRDAKTTWGIDNPSSAPLNLLFDPDSEAVGVNYVGDADYLFWRNDQGYYTYNSKEAAATYNQADQRFYVYNGTQSVTGTSFSCFLPYNEYGSTLSASDGSVNYWFGMDMAVDFYLPSATGTGGNKVDDKDMTFNFSGDDDIFIFVDDTLVLDMSGIHDESFGSIDFSEGSVKQAMSEAALETATKTYFNLSSGNHQLKVYYMERGGWASNLEIQFNMVPTWEYQTGDVQTITAEKTWLDSAGNTIDPENLKDIYKTKGVEVGLFDALSEATEDTFGYTKDGDTYTVVYTDDDGIYHEYVYNADVPSLTYTEDDVTVVDDKTDSEGRVVDSNGYVIAWLEDDILHIRIDEQTLNNDNNWYYAWELLDADGAYEVLELTGSSSYTTQTTREDLTEYNYWSVIGDKEIEDAFAAGEDFRVILTEAAQEADTTAGDTKEAYGWVIVLSDDGQSVETRQVKFSQIATLEEVKDEGGDITSYQGTYGVTSQSEIAALGDGAIWYLEDAGNREEEIGGTVEGFYIYCILNGQTYYLRLNGDRNSLAVTTNKADASEFYYDSLGELMIDVGEGDSVRVEIDEKGGILIDVGEMHAAEDDARIYTFTLTPTSGFAFTAVNTFLPDFTLEKVDSITGDALAGVSFSLTNEEGLYYAGFDEETDEVIWSDEPSSVTTSDHESEYGQIIFHYLADGTYTLTETQAPDGYSMLPSAITITITDGKVVGAAWTQGDVSQDIKNYVVISDDGLSITVENMSGRELPQTGGMGTTIFTLGGLLLVGGAAALLINQRRKQYGNRGGDLS